LTSITATSAQRSSIIAPAMSRSTSPSAPTCSRTSSTPLPSSHSAVSSTAACSVATVTSRRRPDRSNVPLRAQFSASVAPEVKAKRPPDRPSVSSIRSRATSIAAAASRPQRDALWGLANFSSIHGRIAAAASGATGVVA
jgi:hypothetical protein